MMEEPIPPQPDFRQVGRYFTDLGQQFERCANLPAIDGGNRMVEALSALHGMIRGLEQTLSQQIISGNLSISNRLDIVERRLEAIRTEVSVV